MALATTSRWHYVILGHTVYTHLKISGETKVDVLTRALLADQARCIAILDVEVSFPLPCYIAQIDDDNLTEEIYKAQQKKFAKEVFAILQLAPCLKYLYIPSFVEYSQGKVVSECLQSLYSFQLHTLSIQAAEGTFAFVERQRQLVQLTLLPGIAYPRLPLRSRSSINLPRLQTLWAQHRWCSVILPSSPVQSVGLLRDSSTPEEGAIWQDILRELIEAGGHKTVTSLNLDHESLFRDKQPIDLCLYGKAFPNITKLGVLSWKLGSSIHLVSRDYLFTELGAGRGAQGALSIYAWHAQTAGSVAGRLGDARAATLAAARAWPDHPKREYDSPPNAGRPSRGRMRREGRSAGGLARGRDGHAGATQGHRPPKRRERAAEGRTGASVDGSSAREDAI
ncbi:hypothetical protein FRC07_007643 [Ceratobasidium sp. 392]|nr:hypothetical protein FRC07_007643 [Ceratobasidium sp. 392]